MPYELFIALRYLRARRRQSAISVITAIAIVGITVGVAALIVAQALATGFREEVQDKILGGTAHLNLLKPDNSGIENYRELTQRLARVPGVRAASATIYEPVLINAGDRQEQAVIKGVEVDASDSAANELFASMIEGDPRELQAKETSQPTPATANEYTTPPQPPPVESGTTASPDKLNGIILGRELARLMGLRRGDVVTVLSGHTRLTPIGPAPRSSRFRVIGIFAAGLYEYDSKWAYISLAAAQRLTGGEDTAGVIQMKVADIYQVHEIGVRVLNVASQASNGQKFITTNWQELNRPLFAALQLQQRVIVIFFLLLIVIGALNIITTLTMMVIEKQPDIAILRAQGATRQAITRIFMLQGLLIGIVGAVIGTALGTGLTGIANLYHLVSVPAEIYSISHITLRLRAVDCISVGVLAIAISFLATIYPARTAARMKPVEALRYE